MEQTKDDRIAELEKVLGELINASQTPMTKARYEYLESVRAKAALLLAQTKQIKRSAYFISDLEKWPDGGYRGLIATEGEYGFIRTDWNWGSDKGDAQRACDKFNFTNNVGRKEAMIIQLRSMRQS